MAENLFLQGTIAYREDTLENWEKHNPVLHRGEPSVVRDGKDGRWLKIGDGKTPWNKLEYKTEQQGENTSGVESWETVAEITIPEGFSSYSYTITEATYPDMAKITDFYIEMTIPKQSESISGALTVLLMPTVGVKTNIARFETWNHVNYALKGYVFSKLFGGKRHNQYYGFSANTIQNLTNNSMLNAISAGLFKEISISLSDVTKILPAGMQIKIVGCKR